MSIRIIRLQKDGDIGKEYLLLQATAAINSGDYAVIDTTFKNGKRSNINRHYFRLLPSVAIAKDEYILLWTKKGTYHKGKLGGGEPAHIFYYGSDSPIWNDADAENVEVLKVQTIATESTGNKAPFIFRPSDLKYGGKK